MQWIHQLLRVALGSSRAARYETESLTFECEGRGRRGSRREEEREDDESENRSRSEAQEALRCCVRGGQNFLFSRAPA
eukprot:766464-Hanusia_phi.AAC.1